MRKRVAHLSAVVTIAAAMLLTSCSGTAAGENQSDTAAVPGASQAPDSANDTSSAPQGDYAFGAGREDIARAIEKAFSSQNAKATWEDDLFVLSVDGDAEGAMAGYMQCQTLTHLLNEEDVTAIQFPNGRVMCVDALAE